MALGFAFLESGKRSLAIGHAKHWTAKKGCLSNDWLTSGVALA
jgi:hypothetical protein